MQTPTTSPAPGELAKSSGPLELFILQATRFCNVDCTYCYLPNRTAKDVMSMETVRASFQKIFASPFLADSFSVLWHAGEPLAAPLSFYEEAFSVIEECRPSNIEIRQNIQTNGTLINDAWAEFFIKHKVRMGVSLDGPADIHDRVRKTRSGAGTYARVMKGIEVLRRHSIPFHVIAVVSREALTQPDRIMEFFDANGIYDLAFNIEEVEGVNGHSSLGSSSDAEVRSFFARTFEWYATKRAFRVREFDGVIGHVLLKEALDLPLSERRAVGQTAHPMSIISVDIDGGFSTFSPELIGHSVHGKPFVFGNVHTDTFESALSSKFFTETYGEIQTGLELCRSECEYFSLCRGGCPSNKYFESGSFAISETDWCRRSKKAVVDVVVQRLESHLSTDQA